MKCADAARSLRFKPTQESIKDVPVKIRSLFFFFFFFFDVVSTLQSEPTQLNLERRRNDESAGSQIKQLSSPGTELTSGAVSWTKGNFVIILIKLYCKYAYFKKCVFI